MKLPELPSLTIADQLKSVMKPTDYEISRPEEEIKEAIEKQSDVLLAELKRHTDLNEKQLDNQAIKISQLDDLVTETKENGKASSREARRAFIVSIISVIIAITSVIVSILIALR